MVEDLDLTLLDEIQPEDEAHLSPLGRVVLAALRRLREGGDGAR